jgi:hypothetical protein
MGLLTPPPQVETYQPKPNPPCPIADTACTKAVTITGRCRSVLSAAVAIQTVFTADATASSIGFVEPVYTLAASRASAPDTRRWSTVPDDRSIPLSPGFSVAGRANVRCLQSGRPLRGARLDYQPASHALA